MNKKILVIGCPGSGKSYFTRELSNKTGIKRYYLDCIYWQENWVSLPKSDFIKEIDKIMATDEWIIDGNYQSTLEYRIEKANTIYFLDIPEEVCVASEKERRGKKREDLPDYLQEDEDPEFINFIRKFKENGRVIILELLQKYSDKEIIIFTSRDEVNNYLNNL